jgi:hypothetical protein
MLGRTVCWSKVTVGARNAPARWKNKTGPDSQEVTERPGEFESTLAGSGRTSAGACTKRRPKRFGQSKNENDFQLARKNLSCYAPI